MANTMSDRIADIEARLNAATLKDLKYDADSGYIFSERNHVGKDKFIFAHVRGWEYFTGRGDGALGLDAEQGMHKLDANGEFIANAPKDIRYLLSVISALLNNLRNGNICEYCIHKAKQRYEKPCFNCSYLPYR